MKHFSETKNDANYDEIILKNNKFWPIVLTDSMSNFNTFSVDRNALQMSLRVMLISFRIIRKSKIFNNSSFKVNKIQLN